MDIEQLKLILETVGEASDGASTIAMVWIFQGYFTAVLSACITVAVVYLITKMITGFISGIMFYNVLQSHIGVVPDLSLTDNEKRRITELLEDGKKYREEQDNKGDK